jgi:hypothetical protein
VIEDQSVANTDKQTGQNKKICSRLTQKQDEEKFSKPVTEPSPVLAYDTSDDYLAVCDRKSEPVLDIDPRSCQRKWSTKTKTEYHSDITKKFRVIPREDSEENWFHVAEICYNNVDNVCLIYFCLDKLLKISGSISRDVPEVFGQDPHEEVPVCCKDLPRNDCFAILSNGCITALMSESSPRWTPTLARALPTWGRSRSST